ncbi:MAG: hypothetical protein COA69_01105 [Robiginitomaculum sp.]|nr:MAG: hypothetical protein COA69_01105 [Robiginitomaculum sp.]
MSNTQMVHPDRKTMRMRPLKALRHFRNLVADKEDTEQVFHIIQALSGKSFLRDLKRFARSSEGKQHIKNKRFLPPILDDHDAIRKLPEGTVGRAYVDFMESEGLSAAGLVAEYDKFGDKVEHYDDLVEWYSNRLRDTHDLMHVLTGYGRDALGEACVLAVSYGHNRSPGVIFISVMGGREIKKLAPKGAPVMKAVFEGKRTGKNSLGISYQDIPSLLAEPLEAARKRMGFSVPVEYNRVHEMCRSVGQDPYQVLT